MVLRRASLLVKAGTATALVLVLAACTPGGQFDPTTIFANDMFDNKKKLQGDREPVFPNGVPGTTAGVPPDLVKGYQPPPDQAADADANGAPPTAAAAEPEKPKPKPKPKPKVATAPAPHPTRISVGPSGSPPAAPAPQAAPSQSPGSWPAPPPAAPGQPAAQPSQSGWPDPQKPQ
jgi:hypothetical protein